MGSKAARKLRRDGSVCGGRVDGVLLAWVYYAAQEAGKITDAVNTTRSAELLHDLETAKVQLRHHLMMEMLNGYFTSKEQASVPLTAPAVRTSPQIWMPPAAPALPENPYASTEAANLPIKFGGLSEKCNRLVGNIHANGGAGGHEVLAGLTPQLMQVQRFEARLTEVLNTQPKSAMHEDVCQVLEVYFGTGPNVTKPQAPKFSGLADTVLSRQIDFLMRVTSQMEQTMHGRFLEDLLNTIRVGGTTERDQLLDYFDFKLKELAKRTKDPQMKAAVAAMQSEFSSVASGR